MWRYILLIHGERPEVVLKQLAAVTPDPIQEKLMTAGEMLIERGRIEGELKGERQALLKVLARLGPVPEAVVARVNAADKAQIEAWFDRFLIASTLDDVFAS
ncbi:MAG: hypothetical protein QM820_25830 [Minicystis sp.]